MLSPEEIKNCIETEFNVRLNKNQLREVQRLFFDIAQGDKKTIQEIMLSLKKKKEYVERFPTGNRFMPVKELLMKERFPLTSAVRKIEPAEVFLNKLRAPLSQSFPAVYPFRPQQVFIEEQAHKYPLVQRVRKMFPGAESISIKSYAEHVKEHPFRLEELKRPFLFLVKQDGDFIKKCPCTKNHVGCGYFIFNLSFGCPFDCSYCYLQQYTNAPGIVMPANIDDFLREAGRFMKRLKRPVRLGSGEFCDSLALDNITGYAESLVSFFRNKNVFFELKTKSACIDGLLSANGAENIVISWSLNPRVHIESEERCVASLEERLRAANKVRERGYSLGFHFDPIIYTDNWEEYYHDTVQELYRTVKGPFAWISLGTLRSSRALKPVVEQRFPESRIFYGELLLGKDKKLRYPYFLRKKICRTMLQWIREFDTKTPVYLCMEEEAMWKELYGTIGKSRGVEEYVQAHQS